jgi:hypothetical protein
MSLIVESVGTNLRRALPLWFLLMSPAAFSTDALEFPRSLRDSDRADELTGLVVSPAETPSRIGD